MASTRAYMLAFSLFTTLYCSSTKDFQANRFMSNAMIVSAAAYALHMQEEEDKIRQEK